MKTDILIIGGGPAGVVAGMTAKKYYPSKQVTLIRKEKESIIPCGIPYIFNRLDSVDKNLMSDQPLLSNKINLIVSEITRIEPKEKEVITTRGDIYNYDKLILALGSTTQVIPIPGIEKKGVWLVKKDYKYLKEFREAVLRSKAVVIVGGGFVGIEFAEELSNIKNLNVNIVEKLNHCLITNFDEEFALIAEEKLKNRGIKIFTNATIKEIGGKEKVEYVELNNGEILAADLVILSIGARPNTDLAKKIPIKIGEKGGIVVDRCMRTNIPDIFAVGDCAQKKDFVTNKDIYVMLASVAAMEARIATSNLYQTDHAKENKGVIGVFSTCVDDLAFGVAGLTEREAKKQNLNYLIGEAETFSHHPASLPNTKKVKIKLLFSKSPRNLLLGGEVIGAESASEMLNILSTAIQQKTSLFDFNTWQIGTHPLLTAAPTAYPIITAAQDAMFKIKILTNTL